MFAVVPLGVLLSVVSCRGYSVAGLNVGAQASSSRHSASSGRRVMRARLVFWRSGVRGMGADALDKKSTFSVFAK